MPKKIPRIKKNVPRDLSVPLDLEKNSNAVMIPLKKIGRIECVIHEFRESLLKLNSIFFKISKFNEITSFVDVKQVQVKIHV